MKTIPSQVGEHKPALIYVEIINEDGKTLEYGMRHKVTTAVGSFVFVGTARYRILDMDRHSDRRADMVSLIVRRDKSSYPYFRNKFNKGWR